ncbi:hypothetical protein RSOLAG1IB_01903 [Rhizoctonia solani AG-1 IB]|uniref:G-patch domain-containing protein n=1 Tax=Thanatephorus cucumeris (strain AG1-IB / isolate 7/3/14) TaxID=1108050 RepID=A0A0B7FCW3_THACB|nr:hypothetical protein RSOLAG1IB_01903 [Rhizoctonia solani AG-1 IB]
MSNGRSTSNLLPESDSAVYRPDFEWPGDGGPPDIFSTTLESQVLPHFGSQHYPIAHKSSFLRLIVLSSSVLPCKAVALFDSFEEVSIGRDRCATPRLRLKELAASKYHANIYWDTRTEHWSLVDVGSTHGTHLVSPETSVAKLSGSISNLGYTMTELTRLAPSKTASLPRTLSHLQHIIIGSTTLVVHIHDDRLPCDACTITQDNMLDLDVQTKSKVTNGSKGPEPNAAESMKALKRNLFSQPLYSGRDSRLADGREAYVNRAELRRQRFPGWREPQPKREPSVSKQVSSRPYPRINPAHIARTLGVSEQESKSNSPSPIPLDNVGHKLLTKQGWKPGSALGSHTETGEASSGLLEPLAPQSTTNRRGLGMH